MNGKTFTESLKQTFCYHRLNDRGCVVFCNQISLNYLSAKKIFSFLEQFINLYLKEKNKKLLLHKTRRKVNHKNVRQGYNKVKLNLKICIFVILAFIPNFIR